MSECGRDCSCRGDVSRRELLKIGAGAAGLAAGAAAVHAAPGEIPPAAKTPPPREWFEQLVQPGKPIVYTGEHLRNLIFPLGGIGTGTLWLHGSGRLVNWQIFNNIDKSALVDDSFFAVRIEQEGRAPIVRVLQQQSVGPAAGIQDIAFLGRYPVASLRFTPREGNTPLPVEIELEAFNPLIPTNEKDSAIPCAIFTVRARNTSDKSMRISFLASLQNAVGHASSGAARGVAHGSYGGNINRAVRVDGSPDSPAGLMAVAMHAQPGQAAAISPPIDVMTDHASLSLLASSTIPGLSLSGVGRPKTNAAMRTVYWIASGNLHQLGGSMLSEIPQAVREEGAVLLLSGVDNPLSRRVQATAPPDVRRVESVFAAFDDRSFGAWTAKKRAFEGGPQHGATQSQNPVSGFLGSGLVNTFTPDDGPQGSLTSPPFTVKAKYASFLLGGGEHAGRCGINLLVDGKPVRSATGKNSEHLERVEWDLSDLQDREARFEIIDHSSDPWGHVLVDDIRLGNLPIDAVTQEEAKAWNALLDAATQTEPMTPAGVGKGRVLVVPVELGTAKENGDPLRQRDQVLRLLASLTGSTYHATVGLPEMAPSFGTMCLATPAADATISPGWNDRDELLRKFLTTGELIAPPKSQSKATELMPLAGPTEAGETRNGALCVRAQAAPQSTAEATFVFAWHFPHQYYPQNAWRAMDNKAIEVGNMYANWHHDALSVAQSVIADLANLRKQTYAFRDAMFDTSLPQYLVDAVSANVSIIRGPTCFWIKDGTFYGFEGCNEKGGGCCPMNCNHVWNYEQALAKVWPALERNMRITELKYHQHADGGCCHRVEVPRDNPNKRNPPVADGQCGAVLKAYREYLQSADRRFLDEHWPNIKKAMDFAIKEWDPDNDGVMEKPQFNTYDRVIYGHNTFISSLYLAALRAAEEMARLCRDDASAKQYRALFEKGGDRIAKELFDGEYYIQKADNINLGYGKGCWSDQVVGQWWARILNLGDILPNDQMQSALKAIFKHSWLWTQEGFQGTQRFLQFADGKDKGLLCGSWPKGGRPDDPILYRDECWTGVEYQVAAHKIYENQIEEGLAIVRGARERYDGLKKSPWNEIECGDYYARALSSWSVLLAVQGYTYNGPARALTFKPRLSADEHRSFFTTAEGWGRFEQKRNQHAQTNTLELMGGRCDLAELRFGLPQDARQVTGKARLDDRDVVAEFRFDAGMAVVHIGSPITVQAGQRLTCILQWS